MKTSAEQGWITCLANLELLRTRADRICHDICLLLPSISALAHAKCAPETLWQELSTSNEDTLENRKTFLSQRFISAYMFTSVDNKKWLQILSYSVVAGNKDLHRMAKLHSHNDM